MQRAIDLLDFLMKNASSMKEHGHYIYHLIGRKRMMKTLARVARNLTRSATQYACGGSHYPGLHPSVGRGLRV